MLISLPDLFSCIFLQRAELSKRKYRGRALLLGSRTTRCSSSRYSSFPSTWGAESPGIHAWLRWGCFFVGRLLVFLEAGYPLLGWFKGSLQEDIIYHFGDFTLGSLHPISAPLPALWELICLAGLNARDIHVGLVSCFQLVGRISAWSSG